MTYNLPEKTKPFSYTREELFQCVKNIIEQDKSAEAKALAVFCVFEDYLANFTESDNNGGYYIPECDEIDFQDFVRFKLCVDDYDYVSADDILK
jgi:hypothetical protein